MRLTVETGPLAGTVVPLDRDQPSVLGSGAECAIRVQEAGVQPQHAVVKALKDQGFGIKALGAGVRVNGALVEASPLKDGDVIELGTTRIAFGQVQKRGLPRVGGYRIIEELGRGGMGTVYRAEQVSLHREVALKVLTHELTKDPSFVAKFVAEARAAAKLQHPNVVQVFDVEHDGDTYFIAMELMHDGSLEDWLKQNGAMPADRALRVVADAAAGLAYAESLDIVHRDIKPDNLMLDQHGAVKIADLGLARTEDETEEKMIGTPHFMAPEQVLRRPVDHRTDLYALGCTFYRLVTGRTPFRGTTVKDILRAQVKDEAEPPHKARPDVPVEVSAIIQKLMAKEPDDRFQTANDLIEQLNLLLQPPAKKGLWVGLAAAGVLIAGGAIYWAVNKPTEYKVVEKKYDDPEKQQFADEIKRLKGEARETTATIALLNARLGGLPEPELAEALDRLATEHTGTRAAVEAKERAGQLRKTIGEREHQVQQRGGQIRDHLAQLLQNMQPQFATHDYGMAMRSLAAEQPAAIRDDQALVAGLQQLRDQVTTRAKAHLQELHKAIDTARDQKDLAALTAAVEAYSASIAHPAKWPETMHAEIELGKLVVGNGREAIVLLQGERRDSLWHRYRDTMLATDGPAACLQRQDFTGAATALEQFAGAAPEEAASVHGKNIAVTLRHAATFADALETAAKGGTLTLHGDGDTTLAVLRWDRKARTLVVADAAKKPPKEQTMQTAGIGPEVWAELAEQVAGAPAGGRECFLGYCTLIAHGNSARTFLTKLRPTDDDSGTGNDTYPLGAILFDQLLRRLPDDGTQDWVKPMRHELQAGLRLAAGLRALSERRNLAAAGHLDKLLADHPHSFAVLVLP